MQEIVTQYVSLILTYAILGAATGFAIVAIAYLIGRKGGGRL